MEVGCVDVDLISAPLRGGGGRCSVDAAERHTSAWASEDALFRVCVGFTSVRGQLWGLVIQRRKGSGVLLWRRLTLPLHGRKELFEVRGVGEVRLRFDKDGEVPISDGGGLDAVNTGDVPRRLTEVGQ